MSWALGESRRLALVAGIFHPMPAPDWDSTDFRLRVVEIIPLRSSMVFLGGENCSNCFTKPFKTPLPRSISQRLPTKRPSRL
jgi:hypothetical protein